MPSAAESIQTIKDNTLAQMVTVSSERKPSYTADGQQFDWVGYLTYLQGRVDWCNQQLAAESPQEFISYGIVDNGP